MTSFTKPHDEKEVQQCLLEIEDGIFGATVASHHREIHDAQRAINKFLGTDTLADTRQTEFDALPANTKAEMDRNRNYGIYGLFHLATRDEVPLALSVVGKELSLAFEITARNKAALSNPDVAARVMQRFPAITQQRIALALSA